MASALGKLKYVVRTSRRDALWIVGELSRFQHNYGVYHITILEYLVQFLLNTLDRELVFRAGYSKTLPAYIATADASYLSDLVRGRTHWGGVHFFFGCAVAASAKVFATIPVSTCEAEYMANYEIGKEAVYVRKHAVDLTNLELPVCTYVLCDGLSAVYLTNRRNLGGGRVRHMDVKYHWLQQQVQKGTLRTIHVPTEMQYADANSKPLHGKLYWKMTAPVMGEVQFPEPSLEVIVRVFVKVHAEELKELSEHETPGDEQPVLQSMETAMFLRDAPPPPPPPPPSPPPPPYDGPVPLPEAPLTPPYYSESDDESMELQDMIARGMGSNDTRRIGSAMAFVEYTDDIEVAAQSWLVRSNGARSRREQSAQEYEEERAYADFRRSSEECAAHERLLRRLRVIATEVIRPLAPPHPLHEIPAPPPVCRMENCGRAAKPGAAFCAEQHDDHNDREERKEFMPSCVLSGCSNDAADGMDYCSEEHRRTPICALPDCNKQAWRGFRHCGIGHARRDIREPAQALFTFPPDERFPVCCCRSCSNAVILDNEIACAACRRLVRAVPNCVCVCSCEQDHCQTNEEWEPPCFSRGTANSLAHPIRTGAHYGLVTAGHLPVDDRPSVAHRLPPHTQGRSQARFLRNMGAFEFALDHFLVTTVRPPFGWNNGSTYIAQLHAECLVGGGQTPPTIHHPRCPAVCNDTGRIIKAPMRAASIEHAIAGGLHLPPPGECCFHLWVHSDPDVNTPSPKRSRK